MTAGKEDVLRFDVAVHHAVRVRVGERVGDFAGDLNRVLDRQLALPHHARPQRFPIHERHHAVQQFVCLAGVMHGEDVRVGERGGDVDLAEETLAAYRAGDRVDEHLDRHAAVVPHVVREIDRGHPTAADLAIDRVPAGERARQPGRDVDWEASHPPPWLAHRPPPRNAALAEATVTSRLAEVRSHTIARRLTRRARR